MSEMDISKKFGVNIDKLNTYEILCLPENFYKASHKDELYDATSTIELSKVFKSMKISCANSYDLGIDCSTFHRRANDIWLGVLMILTNVVTPIACSILANFLYDYLKAIRKTKNESWKSIGSASDATYLGHALAQDYPVYQRLIELEKLRVQYTQTDT